MNLTQARALKVGDRVGHLKRDGKTWQKATILVLLSGDGRARLRFDSDASEEVFDLDSRYLDWRKLVKRTPTEKAIAPVRRAYRKVKAALKSLPHGHMRTLAENDLESSFSRACFAASGLEEPIGGA